jgi:FKBP-type peptidyl-prolyl cis-trans isomerase
MNFKKALILLSLSSVSLWAKPSKQQQETAKAETKIEAKTEAKIDTKEENPVDAKKLSIAVGHLISKTINDIGVAFDIDLIIKGLKDASMGIASPLSENECISAISQEQKKSFEALAAKNLEEAEKFLAQESQKQDVTCIENGKVLYKILQDGTGDAVLPTGKISIRYKGSLLSGDVFGESTQDETIEINQLVNGLKTAMVGMKEGEKRLIHIHPEMGYGKEGMLPPNSLLSFEIEVAKAKIEEPEQTAQASDENQVIEKESEIR